MVTIDDGKKDTGGHDTWRPPALISQMVGVHARSATIIRQGPTFYIFNNETHLQAVEITRSTNWKINSVTGGERTFVLEQKLDFTRPGCPDKSRVDKSWV